MNIRKIIGYRNNFSKVKNFVRLCDKHFEYEYFVFLFFMTSIYTCLLLKAISTFSLRKDNFSFLYGNIEKVVREWEMPDVRNIYSQNSYFMQKGTIYKQINSHIPNILNFKWLGISILDQNNKKKLSGI